MSIDDVVDAIHAEIRREYVRFDALNEATIAASKFCGAVCDLEKGAGCEPFVAIANKSFYAVYDAKTALRIELDKLTRRIQWLEDQVVRLSRIAEAI